METQRLYLTNKLGTYYTDIHTWPKGDRELVTDGASKLPCRKHVEIHKASASWCACTRSDWISFLAWEFLHAGCVCLLGNSIFTSEMQSFCTARCGHRYVVNMYMLDNRFLLWQMQSFCTANCDTVLPSRSFFKLLGSYKIASLRRKPRGNNEFCSQCAGDRCRRKEVLISPRTCIISYSCTVVLIGLVLSNTICGIWPFRKNTM